MRCALLFESGEVDRDTRIPWLQFCRLASFYPRLYFLIGAVRMENGGEKFGDGTAACPLDQEARLDLAEELFVSCRFTEAARVCTDALSASPASGRDRGGSDLSGSNLVVAFEDQIIAPVGECSTCDLIVAVLLQCGFELQRTEEWHSCRDFYGASGAMPFAVAILW